MKVRELLDSPEKWTKGYEARLATGKRCFARSRYARSWSLSGAIMRCYPRKEHVIRKRIQSRIGQLTIPDWNDDPKHTFEEVRSLIEELDV
jgi:hypothetical protein